MACVGRSLSPSGPAGMLDQGKEQTCLLLRRERLVCGQDDQQLLQSSTFNGFHLDLWIAAGRSMRNRDTLWGPGSRELGS